MPFHKEDFHLRPITINDQERMLLWRNSELIRANMYTDHIISSDEHNLWFQNILKHNDVHYRIFEYQEQPIGLVCVTEIDLKNHKCTWGFYLGEKTAPRGSGAVMEYIAIQYIFENINIQKICCEVFNFNTATIKLHKKFGFREEGYFYNHILKNGNYEDIVFLSLFKVEWSDLNKKIEKKLFRI